MNRRRRTEILIKGSRETAGRLAEEIMGKYEVKIIEEPNHGLVMVKMREGALQSLFYLGEVFVTEAKVQINGTLGMGIVSGNQIELAYHLSVIDAAYNAALPETTSWEEILLREEEAVEEGILKEQSKILKTKVSFETMKDY